MSSIYTAATRTRTLIWLGEDSKQEDGRRTFRLLTHLNHLGQESLEQIHNSRQCQRGFLVMGYYHSLRAAAASDVCALIPDSEELIMHKDGASYLDDFPSRTYFRQLWIVHELFCTSNGLVMCGSNFLDWHDFQQGLDGIAVLIKGIYDDPWCHFELQHIWKICQLMCLSKRDDELFKYCIDLGFDSLCSDLADRVLYSL